MLCPIDQTELVITERQGVEIDYCPKCRGVWLDRGELDKIIDRSGSFASGAAQEDERYVGRTKEVGGMSGKVQRLGERLKSDYDDDDRDRYEERHDERGRYDEHGRPRRKKRGSFLEDLFDFD
jgi:Zn-finger nucleic acid-binding protein